MLKKTKTIPDGRPKLSVISFCLNSSSFLRETIDSVLNQTYKNFEFIIKDGGSTDGTIEILKDYPQIRWISEKESTDNPVHEAICRAFDMAKGEYVIYLAVSDESPIRTGSKGLLKFLIQIRRFLGYGG